jgi:hypothetical protein
MTRTPSKAPKPPKTAAEKKVDAYEKEYPKAMSFSRFTDGEVMKIANPRSKASPDEVRDELNKRGYEGDRIVEEWKTAEQEAYREKHPEEFDDEDSFY